MEWRIVATLVARGLASPLVSAVGFVGCFVTLALTHRRYFESTAVPVESARAEQWNGHGLGDRSKPSGRRAGGRWAFGHRILYSHTDPSEPVS
jgi:hypothetical protein